MEELETLKKQAYDAAKEILEIGKCKAGDLFVVGCSTSEVLGDKIGTASSPETAQAVFAGIYQAVQEKQVYLAAQCCEHLNRALIIEEEAARKFGYEEVNVVPQPKAGGSFATAAYHAFAHPTAVEHIKASAGMDIGVAVPVRISQKQIGCAHVVCARTRAKFIGGVRAIYDENRL